MIIIGTIHTPFSNLENMPIQPKGAIDVSGHIELLPEYAAGLQDLDGFSHIYLIYQFHKATRTELTVTPFMDTTKRGVYSTRSPIRPNHIGLSLVQFISVEENIVNIKGVDILNGTPLLDIKPFIPAFDQVKGAKSGWMTKPETEVASRRSDNRFI